MGAKGIGGRLMKEVNLLAQYFNYIFPSMADIPLVLRYLKISGGPLLDLGCATGRVLKAALESDVVSDLEVYGIDDDASNLEVAFGDLKSHREQVHLLRGDYSELTLQQKMGTITSLQNTISMGMTTRDQRKAMLAHWSNHLKDNGNMIVQFRNGDNLETCERSNTVRTIDGELEFCLSCSVNREKKQRKYVLDMQIGQQSEQIIFDTSLIYFNEFISDVSEINLYVWESYGDYNDSPLTEDSDIGVFILKHTTKSKAQ